MRIVILFFLLIISSLAYSQKKLKYDISKVGDTMYHSSEEKIYGRSGSNNSVYEYLKSTIYRVNGAFSIEFSIQTGRTSVFGIDKDSPAEFTLADGNIVTLYAVSNNQSRPSRLAYGCFMFAFYRLNRTAIEQLKASPVVSIRLHTSFGTMDYPIKEKMSDTISEQLGKF